MVSIRTLRDGQVYIGQYINGTEVAVDLNGDILSSDGDGKLYWNGVQVAVGEAYVLPPATTTTLGGVKIGSGLLVTSDGTASVNWPEDYKPEAHTHEVADIIDFPENVSEFTNDVQYQTLTQVQTLLTNWQLVKHCFIVDQTYLTANPTSGYALGDFVFIGHNDAVLAVFNTIAEIDLRVMTGAELDPGEDDPNVDQAKKYIVINFGEPNQSYTELEIPAYTGDNTQTHIQTVVNGTVISAILKAGTIQKDRLTTALQAEIDAKIQKKFDPLANEGVGAPTVVPNNLAKFTNVGDIADSGVAVSDLATDEALRALKKLVEEHNHDGEDTPPVDYVDLDNQPIIIYETTTTGALPYMMSKKNANIDYMVAFGEYEQYGTVKYRYNVAADKGNIREVDVFGDDMEVGAYFTLTGKDQLNLVRFPGITGEYKVKYIITYM